MDTIRDQAFIKERLGSLKLYTSNLLKILWAIQDEYRYIPQRFIHYLCSQTELTAEAIYSVISFYHYFSLEHRGDNTIYLDTSITAEMSGYKAIRKAFEQQLGIKVGEVSSCMQFGLFETSCMGLADQGPAALINHQAYTNLTPEKVKQVVADLMICQSSTSLPASNIRQSGPIFFQTNKTKSTLKKMFKSTPEQVVEIIKASGLRGRGGAGFPTGTKWEFCRQHEGPRYVFANGDEGEPGTFKDRALLMKSAKTVFLGMMIAGYALQAMRGFLYLRAEYFYLLNDLNKTLNKLRQKGLLGHQILGSNFTFDISIKLGAGAYICGEESALIESAEGKRGEPRNRPPFPVEVGYLGRPTTVNNLETLSNLPSIIARGANWFASLGTTESKGTKLLSIAGDCNKPGVYEVEFGTTVNDILAMVDAKNTQAIQVGGPSGKLINTQELERKICFEDLPTGGAITIFNTSRDILNIVKNYSNFFMEESCGFCVPCRAGNVIINEVLDKIIEGKGVARDLEQIKETAKVIAITSRCGLGQTSGNPIMQSLDKFGHCYQQRISKDMEFISEFDLQESLRKAREGLS